MDIITDDDHDIASLIRYHRRENAYNGNIYDHEVRSAAAIARYARIKYGLKGVVEISDGFVPQTPSADRGESFAGLAWAPDDVPDEHVADYVRGDLKQWAAWAAGDTFGWVLTGPDGEEVEDGAVWGFYGFWDGDERAYTLSEARNVAESDAAERIKQANTVGAGFISLI